MQHRQDIQILRGIAVALVVVFHLEIGVLKSGFLGVDVFFVVSGFLMAVLYKQGSIEDFFTRRARRLFPAYYVTIIATLVASYIFTTPNETEQVLGQALYGSAFFSNIGFWLQGSYFRKIEFNPLLHLWSLGVEVQFYLLVPLLGWLAIRCRACVPLILLLSLALCFLILEVSPNTSFYMMPLRMWEFLFGYAAALYFSSGGDLKYEGYGAIGAISAIAIIAVSMLEIDGQAQSILWGHPGLASLVIVIFTTMVLVFGLPEVIQESLVSRALAKLGDYSYSTYLAHFPVVVIYLSEPFAGTVLSPSGIRELFELLFLILVSSVLLHRFVERQKTKLGVWRSSVAANVCILSLVALLPSVQGASLSDEERKIFYAFQDRSEHRCGKFFVLMHPTTMICSVGKVPEKPLGSVLLIGNSHADSIKTTFANIASTHGFATYFLVPNNPLMPGGPSSQQIISEALSLGIDQIFLHYSMGALAARNLLTIVDSAERVGIGVKVIDPVPAWDAHIPKFMYEKWKGSPLDLTKTAEDYFAENASFFSELKKIESENFSRVSLVEAFCSPVCEYSSIEGHPYYFDSNHLTLTGSLVIKDVLEEALASILAPKLSAAAQPL